jgi:GntR family transcriptional repressor for pyruvate dehydrogenase complex
MARRAAHLYDDLTTMSIIVSARSDPKAIQRTGVLPLETERLSDRLAASIAERIDGGAFKPGDRLPTELQFAATYGVSRTVVREAVHQLKSQGLVRSRQGSGVFVTAPPAHRALAFDPKLLGSMDAVLQMVELRRVIEGEMPRSTPPPTAGNSASRRIWPFTAPSVRPPATRSSCACSAYSRPTRATRCR